MNMQGRSTIGLIELPVPGLIDPADNNWLFQFNSINPPLISKQILISNLRAQGFDAQLINLRKGNYAGTFGKVKWGDVELTKTYFGTKIEELDPLAYDAWGVTNNFTLNREIAYMVIKHLSSKGRPVVVGGSDIIAAYSTYLAAGATAAVLDKSGGANGAIMDYVLGLPLRAPLSGVVLREGTQPPIRAQKLLHPEDWPLPEISLVQECLGERTNFMDKEGKMAPSGAVMIDIGCNNKCDFCQTPQYHLGYRAMTPEKSLKWCEIQKQAGASSVHFASDQLMGRVLRKNGREEILEIMNGVRDLGIPVFLSQGLNMKLLTKGHGLKRTGGDLTPDEEFISSVYNWNGKVGCYYNLIPAERPLHGRENYNKLLPWQAHCEVVKSIVRAGVPNLSYNVIIGFQDDSEDSLLQLEEALLGLYEDVTTINPSVNFLVSPLAIIPIPGTPLETEVIKSGLMRFDDTMFYMFDIPLMDTRYLAYKDISRWQARLAKIGCSSPNKIHQLKNDYI